MRYKNIQKEQKVVCTDCLPNEECLTLLEGLPNIVRKLTHQILAQSIKDKASDFYLRKTKEEVKMVYKLEGTRYDMIPPPSYLYEEMRGEILSLMSINAKRIRVCGEENLEADVSLANISKSNLHLKFVYD